MTHFRRRRCTACGTAGRANDNRCRNGRRGRPGTLHRWLREDCAFQAARNRDRNELRRAAYHRLEKLAAKAAECLEKAIDGGDVKAALEIVKGMGILAPNPIGSEDASELALEAKERQNDREERTMFASLR